METPLSRNGFRLNSHNVGLRPSPFGPTLLG
jgi:hypothetical protein